MFGFHPARGFIAFLLAPSGNSPLTPCDPGGVILMPHHPLALGGGSSHMTKWLIGAPLPASLGDNSISFHCPCPLSLVATGSSSLARPLPQPSLCCLCVQGWKVLMQHQGLSSSLTLSLLCLKVIRGNSLFPINKVPSLYFYLLFIVPENHLY